MAGNNHAFRGPGVTCEVCGDLAHRPQHAVYGVLDNKVKGGRICLVCHSFWPDTEVLCPGCLEAMR